MIMPIFASVIVLVLLLAYENKKHSKQAAKNTKEFWDKEALANSTRKKSLDNLEYITIPDSILSLTPITGNEKVAECFQTLAVLKDNKIVNLTGLSNTDLKLQYGAANITVLTDYDLNYTSLVTTLQNLAAIFYKEGRINDATVILEFAISTRTDISKSYFLLADIYVLNHTPEKIQNLIEIAESLNSVMRKTIVRTLQGSGPYSD